MRFPKFLQKNGTIGFIAPSFGCSIEPYESAFKNSLQKWKGAGFDVKLGPNCFESKGIGISNTKEKCGEEVNCSFLDKDSDVLISCGGGELMCEILDHIDFQAISNSEPKWFMGYSDNTNLTFLLPTLCDTAAIYGPCAASFGTLPQHESMVDAYKLLCGEKRVMSSYDMWEEIQLKSPDNPLCGYNLTRERIHKIYYENNFIDCANNNEIEFEMDGRLIGGCVDCLVNLLGTQYDRVDEFCEKYREDGIIWFLEACDLNVFSIRRAMWQMEHAGWFKHVKGFLIGRAKNSEELMGLDVYNAFVEWIKDKNVPIIMDMDIGHMPPMMPLIAGSMANVKVKGNNTSITMSLE